MKFKSVPGRVVQKRVRKMGKVRIVVWFTFDDKGYAEIDETKVSSIDLAKLKTLFKVVSTEVKDMSYQELQVKYAEKTGSSAVGMKKKDLIKELEG
jgi:hypothetical protein